MSDSTQARRDAIAAPTISIYQHAEHVSGILQQMTNGPLLTAQKQESGDEKAKQKKADVNGQAKASGKAAVPFFGEGSASLDAGAAATLAANTTSTLRSTWEFTYSQASYLHRVRHLLGEQGLLKVVKDVTQASALNVGDFVEFDAKFAGDQVASLLDIATPQLVRAIVAKREMEKTSAGIDWSNYEDRESQTAKARFLLAEQQAFWEAVVEAVKSDFRSNETLEYYGHIGEGPETVTAVTICDRAHFLVDDHDRILDGRFRVLAKVTDQIAEDRPLLERNKLLDRIEPEAVDALVEQMRAALRKSDNPMSGSGLPTAVKDLGFESRIGGKSFKVVPIAIYV